jgi:L-amino acid N-acyltransferase
MAVMKRVEIDIREATVDDIGDITAIYNHAVTNLTATFDMREKTVADRLRWLASHGGKYPAVVAVIDGVVVGWGSLSRFHERPGWRFTVENAVYVSPHCFGRGIGRAIMEHLIDRAQSLGHHAIIAQIAEDNESSIRLHEKLGFEKVGVLKEVGHKFERWIDVVLMERVLSEK